MKSKDLNIVENLLKVWKDRSHFTSDKAWEAIVEILQIRRLNKNTCILDYNYHKKNKRFYYVYSGIIKSEYHLDDSSFVNEFITGPSPCNTQMSNITPNIKNRISLTTITPTILIEIEDIDIISSEYSYDLYAIILSLASNYATQLLNKTAFLRLFSAEERYQHLITNSPEILEHAKQKDIASYLNITPHSFSRLKRVLTKIKTTQSKI